MFENVDRTKWMARINVQDLKEDKVWSFLVYCLETNETALILVLHAVLIHQSDPRFWLTLQVVMKQHKLYVPLSLFVAFGVPLVCFQDTTQALFYGGFLARCLTWHSTWFVNSLAHWLGSDEYSNETSAKVKLVLTLASVGSSCSLTRCLSPHHCTDCRTTLSRRS